MFDHETDAIKVESIYTHAALAVTLKQAGPLWIRMPSWLPPEQITLEGVQGAYRFTSNHLFVATQPVGIPVKMRFGVPVRDSVLRHRTRDIRVRLRGDRVEAMDNFGADLTYFDPL